MSGIRKVWVETPQGPIEAAVAGRVVADRPTLVLVHGIQGTQAVWDAVIPVLAQDWHVIAPNLRGRGGSFVVNNAEHYRMTDFADDLAEVMDGIAGNVVLVGWSMGGLVALEHLQRRGSDRMAGLALLSTSACLHAEGLEPAVWFHGNTPDTLVEEARVRARRLKLTDTAADIAVAGAWLSAAQVDYRPALDSIDVPVLVLHGTADPECPPDHGNALAAGLATSRLELWQGCGHVPMAEQPGALAETLAAFASGCCAAVAS
ncbi:AB hydrolase superfamily protein YdjP [Roseovarius sp. A-2]|uniref:alpha/beta fold hydrolase n=1 Tax=Roseovarius sp. A-2 TaxID=1570360 RepID=UPI0009B55CA5|nr:alpha/beta fold hydrolase [Roseovarius sp. A-2]GAW35410.1 AB hydrolase superfamily protein YdjP [Roseovarius sp. A-2]